MTTPFRTEPQPEPTPEFDEIELGAQSGAEDSVNVHWSALLKRRMQGRMEQSSRRSWIVLATVLLGIFSSGFSLTVLAVTLADIATELKSTPSVLTWAITGPVLAMAVLGPIGGKLADRLGARRVYLVGMVGVAFFSAAAIFAWSAGSLVAFRFLGASLGAAVSPSALAMINRTFSAEKRPQALGYWSLVGAGSPVIGVVVASPLVEIYGWRSIFIVQTPLAIIAVIVGFLLLPATQRGERQPFDIPGPIVLALGVGSLLFALNRGPDWGFTSPAILIALAICPLFITAFVFVENRVAYPLLPMRYFKKRNFTFPIMNQFAANFAYMGGFILTPLLLTKVLGYSTAQTGWISIARPIAFSIIGPVAGYFVLRFGERKIGMFGSTLLAISLMLLATISASTGLIYIEIALVINGLGMGACAPAMIAALANSVDRSDLGVAGAASQTVSQVGVVAGMQLLLTIQQAREGAIGDESYGSAYHFGAFVAALAIAAAFFVKRSTYESDEVELNDEARSSN